MPVMTKYPPGTPSWVDLGTSDPVDASRFYSGLFGWSIMEGPPEAGGYRMCMLDDKPVAGLGPQMNPDMPPWWTTYISVADADETAAAIKADGGVILVEPMDVLDVGRMAVASDPAGAMFSIWQPRTHIGAGIVNEPNTLFWNELTTRDPQHSIEFYGAVFGWVAVLMPTGVGEGYAEFHIGDRSVGGLLPMTGDERPADAPNHWMVYFAVEDCDAMAERVVDLGGTVPVPPTDVPVGRFAVVNDPQGAVFSMIAVHPTAA
jgi:uncharacterized protein